MDLLELRRHANLLVKSIHQQELLPLVCISDELVQTLVSSTKLEALRDLTAADDTSENEVSHKIQIPIQIQWANSKVQER